MPSSRRVGRIASRALVLRRSEDALRRAIARTARLQFATAALSGALTVEDVRRVAFRSQRGGYDEGAVDELLDRVVEALLLQRHRATSDDKGRDEHISHPQA